MYNASGGVYVSDIAASFVMSGGKIKDNNNNSNIPGKPADVSILNNTITLSGTAEIGALMLTANDSTNSSVSIPAAYTGSVSALNLSGDANIIGSVDEVVGNWTGKQVITGTSYTLTATDIAKFTLGNFVANTVTRPITGNTEVDVDNFSISGDPLGVLKKGYVAVTGVTLNKTETTLVKDGTEILIATVVPSNATNMAVTWESNNIDVAIVNNGTVTAVDRGTATITVTSVADNSKKATCTVTVTNAGTSVDPYEVWTAADMQRVGKDETNGWGLDKHYTLMDDIILTGNWTPIGTNLTPFSGVFDGGGFSVSGLTISSATTVHQGMFGMIAGTSVNLAVVKNLSLVDVNITSSGNSVGGIAGTAFEYAQINNCSVSGIISGNGDVGGVVGRVELNNTVENCYVTGSISSSNENVGGVVGHNRGGIVQNCYATANVKDTGTATNIGGVVGYNYNNGTVQNCYATGNVSGFNNVGGVVGQSYVMNTVKNCVALNPNIGAMGNNFGRVIGNGSGANNYARNDMQKSGAYFDWPNKDDAASNNGKNITADDYDTQEWWSKLAINNGPAFDFSDTGVWEWHSTNKLPILKGFAPNTQNPTVTANTTGYFEITVKEIINPELETINSAVTISRTGAEGYAKTATFTLSNDVIYDANGIKWSIKGVGNYENETIVLSTDNSCEVDATEVKYNSLGGHSVYLEVKIGGKWYSTNIEFTIVR
jgi:hypothetical protein